MLNPFNDFKDPNDRWLNPRTNVVSGHSSNKDFHSKNVTTTELPHLLSTFSETDEKEGSLAIDGSIVCSAGKKPWDWVHLPRDRVCECKNHWNKFCFGKNLETRRVFRIKIPAYGGIFVETDESSHFGDIHDSDHLWNDGTNR